jgi:triacylglycerol esterase/lipase EstA (alpha/beta hydrolase family)
MPSLHRPHWLRRAALAALATSAVAVALASVLVGPAQAATRLPVNYDFIAGATATALAPDTPPPGADNWSCQLTAAHPDPVILVNGTFANMDDNWQAASPLLANNGYCVYAFNYGGTSPTSPIQGVGDIAASAAQLSTFVNTVLAATGAPKVDLVGHSQGGMMPRYYINFLGGASKVQLRHHARRHHPARQPARCLQRDQRGAERGLRGLRAAGARIGVPRQSQRHPDGSRRELHRDRER